MKAKWANRSGQRAWACVAVLALAACGEAERGRATGATGGGEAAAAAGGTAAPSDAPAGEGAGGSWAHPDAPGDVPAGEGAGDTGEVAAGGSAAGGSSWADEGWEAADAGAPDDEWGAAGGVAEQGEPRLEGAEIDDNASFAAFVAYYEQALESFGADPAIHGLDLHRRHLLTVRDAEGHTVPDAEIRILDGEREVTRGHTLADGRFAFFPEAEAANKFVVEATRGDVTANSTLLAEVPLLDVALPEAVPAPEARLDVAFLIDCTGSMGEEIDRIKTTVASIAARIEAEPAHPALRLGLVAYRDRGDAFVTRTWDFTGDVATFQSEVDLLEAGGGDDFPESLNAALHDGVRALTWTSEPAARLAFIVADAPAHFYADEQYTYADALRDASRAGIKFFPIASGGADPVAELQFRQLAVYTLGHFVYITEGGGSAAGSGGSDYAASEGGQLRVENLDDLIVRLVSAEVTAFTSRAPAPAP